MRARVSPHSASGRPTTAASSTARDARERVLDLARVHVEAAADDHVVEAVDDGDEAVGVAHRNVAGVHPAFRVEALGIATRHSAPQ